MTKTALKTAITKRQSGRSAISGVPLSDDQKLNDTHRLRPKAQGGTYTDTNNVVVLEPRTHLAEHGNLRDREVALEDLKNRFDDRVQVMKLQLKINNQLLAYERRVDQAHPETSAFLREQLKPVEERLAVIDRDLAKALKAYPDALAQAALKVKGLGPITVAALAVYIDLNKAATPSALWKYVGLHVASHDRYVKGQAGGGNKTLRTVLWNTANVLMKLGEGGYREVYDRVKERLAQSEKVVRTRNTEGKLIECAWRDTKPSHRHGAALRAVIKHLLADYWLVGRTLAGLSTTPLYAESMLGHTHIVSPRERGWDF